MDEFHSGLLSKAASAYEHLRKLATRGLLRPDRRLSPPDLATELKISITPVRDALTRLAAEGFICGLDGRGYFTKPYTLEEQHDLRCLLLLCLVGNLDPTRPAVAETLEASLAELQAVAVGLPVIESPEGTVEPESTTGAEPAAVAYVEAVDQMLFQVASVTHNQILPGLIRNATDRTRYIRQLDARWESRRLEEVELFRRLPEILRQGDLARAISEKRQYLAGLQNRLPALVAEANEITSRLRFP